MLLYIIQGKDAKQRDTFPNTIIEDSYLQTFLHTLWRNNWATLSTYFKYPTEMRKMIYTTNSIENFNRQLRKVTKAKSIFPTDDSLFKSLYLAMIDITNKWSGVPREWPRIMEHLFIYFADRVSQEDLY